MINTNELILKKIFQSLDLHTLYHISLCSKLFYIISKDVIDIKYVTYKKEYMDECIKIWKEFVFIDMYGLEIYYSYLESDETIKLSAMDGIIGNRLQNQILYIIYTICYYNLKNVKKIFLQTSLHLMKTSSSSMNNY